VLEYVVPNSQRGARALPKACFGAGFGCDRRGMYLILLIAVGTEIAPESQQTSWAGGSRHYRAAPPEIERFQWLENCELFLGRKPRL
jgi:hypothetical protein